MTLHAAFVRLPWQTHYRCTTCRARVAPGARVAHLNAATNAAATYGTTTPTDALGHDQ